MTFDVALGRGFAFGLHVLNIGGKGYVRDFAIDRRSAASEFRHVFNMGWTHYACVVSSHIHEETIESYVLLGKGVTQVVIWQSSDGQYRLTIEFGVIKPIEQVNAAWT